MSKKFTLLATLLAGTTLYAQQNDSLSLDEVVVTATKSTIKQSQTGKITTVLDQKMISNHIGRSLTELLNTQAGFFINGSNNAPGTNQDLYFRGAVTGSMLVVIDGIPVYDPSQISNAFDLNSISLDQVEKIEILKGGQGTLWGSDAVAGVVQIFLKKNSSKKAAINALASYGSYQTFKSNLGISGNHQQLSYNLQYSFTKSAGLPAAYDSTGTKNFRKNGFEQNNLLAELKYRINPALSFRLFADLGNYRTSYPGGPFTDEKDYNARNNNNLGGLSLQYQKKHFTWMLMGSIQHVDRSFTNDSGYVSSPYTKFATASYTGTSRVLETYANQKIGSHLQLVAGIQHMYQNTAQSYFSTGSFGPYKTSLGKDSANINQTSLYASILLLDVHGWNVETGGRLNSHSIYGTNATYTINPSFQIDANTKLFVNLSSSYKIPSLYQLYSDYGNKALKPENSTTWELGIQTNSADKKFFLRLAAFKRNINNLIIFYTNPTTFKSQYVNRTEQKDHGFEMETNIRIGNASSWITNVTFVDGKGIQNGVEKKNLYRRPKFVLNSAFTIQAGKDVTLTPSFKYVGTRLKGEYDAGPAEQASYYTVDLITGVQINSTIKAFLDVRNITNQQYFDIVGYTSKRFNLMAGLTIKL